MIAAERTGRSAVLLEIDPCHVDVIVPRRQEATVQEAVLEDGGWRFNEIAAGPIADGRPPSRAEHDTADIGQSVAPSVATAADDPRKAERHVPVGRCGTDRGQSRR